MAEPSASRRVELEAELVLLRQEAEALRRHPGLTQAQKHRALYNTLYRLYAVLGELSGLEPRDPAV